MTVVYSKHELILTFLAGITYTSDLTEGYIAATHNKVRAIAGAHTKARDAAKPIRGRSSHGVHHL